MNEPQVIAPGRESAVHPRQLLRVAALAAVGMAAWLLLGTALKPQDARKAGSLAILMTSDWRAIYRLLLVMPIGWIAGYLSWILLDRWALDEPWGRSLLWPFEGEPGFAVTWTPFAYFGTVAALFFLCLCIWGFSRSRVTQAACACGAGVLGSLWFWCEFQPWYFAVIHGAVWGLLVGWGISRVNQPGQAREFVVA